MTPSPSSKLSPGRDGLLVSVVPWRSPCYYPGERENESSLAGTPHNAPLAHRLLVIGSRPVSKSLWHGTEFCCLAAGINRGSPLAVLAKSLGELASDPAGGRLERKPQKLDDDRLCRLEVLTERAQSFLCRPVPVQASPWSSASPPGPNPEEFGLRSKRDWY